MKVVFCGTGWLPIVDAIRERVADNVVITLRDPDARLADQLRDANVILPSNCLIDREAISMRPVALAALVVLALRPESLLGASFQMSFAAVVALVLIWGAQSIIRDAFHILLEGVPKGISIQEVEKELTSIPAIKGIHELHVWSICSNIYALSTHALVNDQKVNQVETILQDIESLLRDKFNITHSTIQFESNPCSAEDVACDIKH